MQRKLLVIAVLTSMVLSAAPTRLIRLTVVNKSGMPVGIRLLGSFNEDLFYYLRVAEGDRAFPTIETFTISPDTYSMQIYYVEYYDPVYGFKCGQPLSGVLVASGNVKIVVRPCSQRSASGVEFLLRLLLLPPRYRF